MMELELVLVGSLILFKSTVLLEKTWKFPCKRWFDAHQGDNLIERDLIIDGKPGPDFVRYRVSVVTGTVKGAGTDANVHLTLVGSTGRVDKALLDNEKNNFEQGKVDIFFFETLDMGDIKQAIIEHDGTGIGSGWFLDKIFVLNETSKQRWTFPCNRWLDKKEDDGQTQRTLTPGSTGRTTFQLKVVTSKAKGAGTDANVHCVITGKKGKSEVIVLKHSNHVNKFEEGQTDNFTVDSADVGDVTALTLGHDNSGLGASWMADSAELVDLATGSVFKFAINQWFDKKKGDGLLERTIAVSK